MLWLLISRGSAKEGSEERTLRNAEDGFSPLTWAILLVVVSSE
jgi:hypothetical protein